ncbi:MAG: stage II sporulation protein M [Paracoccaceae bacterium]
MNKSPTDNDLMRSARFRKDREPAWRKLEVLVTKVEKEGIAGLSYADAKELATLYRQGMTSLALARDISLDLALLTYLDQLCARAWLVVYAPQRSLAGLFARLLSHGIPQAVRRSLVPLTVGILAMFLGALAGYVLFMRDTSWFFTFVPGGLSDGRAPGASVEYLRSTLYGVDEDHATDMLAAFAAYLFSHNTNVAIFTFALGIFWAAPSFLLTFYNGLVIGAFFGLFVQAGLGYDAFAWLSIHGVTELAAICIACAGGARLGIAALLPGAMSRRDSLRVNARDAVKLFLLSGLMLLVAGLVEGFLRQLITDPVVRLSIGWGLGVLWVLWLSFSGREARE